MTDRERGDATRRDAMRAELLAAMDRRNRRRRRRARLVTALAAVALAFVSWQVAVVPHRSVPPGTRLAGEPPPARLVRRVQPRPTGRIRHIGDDELVRRLNEIDRPAGLIRSDGRAWLAEQVADDR